MTRDICWTSIPLERISVVINFTTEEDVGILRDIEQYYSTQIDEMPMKISDIL